MPRKVPQATGLALLLLASSGQARAQDITVLVVALVPPIVLAPVCLTIARRLWLGRSSHTTPGILSLFAVSTIEVVLWLALAGSVVVILSPTFPTAAAR